MQQKNLFLFVVLTALILLGWMSLSRYLSPPKQAEVVKTDESEKVMPLDDEMVADLLRWRSETPYVGEQDWIFR